MKKRKFLPLLFVASLGFTSMGLSSCDDQQDITVDFGSRTYVNDYSSLIAAIKDASTTLSAKLDLINNAVTQGFATTAQKEDLIKTAIDTLAEEVKNGNKSTADALAEIKAAIESQTADMNDKLVAIQEALTQGLADVTEGQTLIKEAIASLEAQVEAGNKSNADALAEIKSAIEAQTVSLENKLIAIQEAVTQGLADISNGQTLIKDAIEALQAEVKEGNKANAEALAEIKSAIEAQTTELSSKIALLQEAMNAGFTDLDSALSTINETIIALNNDVKAGLDNIEAGLDTANESLAQMIAALAILNSNIDNLSSTLIEIQEILVKHLDENGVTVNPDYTCIYVTPGVWYLIETAGRHSHIYKSFVRAIAQPTFPKVTTMQVTPGNENSAIFKRTGCSDDAILVAGSIQDPSIAKGKPVMKVTKTPVELYYNVDASECTYNFISTIRVFDARGDYQTYGGANGYTMGCRKHIGESTTPETPRIALANSANITVKTYYCDATCNDIKIDVFTGYGEYSNHSWTYYLPELFWPSDK